MVEIKETRRQTIILTRIKKKYCTGQKRSKKKDRDSPGTNLLQI